MMNPASATLMLISIPLVVVQAVLVRRSSFKAVEASGEDQRKLKMTLCPASGCSTTDPACKSFTTPLKSCFNGQQLYPVGDFFGEFDIYDEIVAADRILHRRFYASTDGTCTGDATDDYRLDLGQCVGPFGEPLPWGTFTVEDFHKMEQDVVTSF
mmetsp:Transcript_6119/g.8897  ORF Transcript_6119/g.8897 Transcript_6119/m.8897 type:complete len:155 (-) Transcript_6119:295-759(-)|eukprot:CAMPEP_0196804014 /NCGR_PEP_ID=MMETSP1362-20130617/3533_1 /TAXON_ID=163516 /ORGANISM="Leptocylindrus danicus, Strain CCMP1856" /LENGTH=154 /DNA_ID=CAMNT_0042175985 /DNA_START=31 /DNA_END=495 /DNA_ORIENTATION=-